MHSQIFVNLPVKDLKRSVDFFTKLGYTFNPTFTDENATCMILGDNLFVMLLVEKFFISFTNKTVADTSKTLATLRGSDGVFLFSMSSVRVGASAMRGSFFVPVCTMWRSKPVLCQVK